MDASAAVPETTTPGALERGRFSALLAELARVPPAEVDEAWSRPPSVGDVLGRYELVREIGRGGFGIVYAARDRELGRFVALKVLRPSPRARALLATEWIQREADAAAQLNHPAIATLHEPRPRAARRRSWPRSSGAATRATRAATCSPPASCSSRC